ncbi:MAG TPA: hypothetical protein VMU51_22820 [Mycobacteriales bacterium]|nr:hypothetical protein [Mycobacteriales bacterium]
MMGRGMRGDWRHGPGGRGFGRSGGWQQADLPPAGDAPAWFAGRLPDGWFTGAPELSIDRDEIMVVGQLAAPTVEGGDEVAVAAAEAGRISRFREETRDERIAIAREAEQRYGRKVAWGVQAGGTRQLFTTLSAPVMTRLRQPERKVLDTLVDAGVARSRSEALAWCVRLVGDHADSWLAELRSAMSVVDELRAQGPEVGEPTGEPGPGGETPTEA